jgi:hypothetical protein
MWEWGREVDDLVTWGGDTPFPALSRSVVLILLMFHREWAGLSNHGKTVSLGFCHTGGIVSPRLVVWGKNQTTI